MKELSISWIANVIIWNNEIQSRKCEDCDQQNEQE